VLARLRKELSSNAYNIAYPAWELSIYPREWAKELERFDEVWAQSRIVYEALKKAVSKPVFYLPLASEVTLSSFLDRRYFGIPESSYVFLFFFDFTSFIDRKNPFAVLSAFEKVCMKRPSEDVRLVMKIGGSIHRQEDHNRFMAEIDDFKYRDRLIIIDKLLGNNEIKNLVRCCDCFISLHRSEGFGRGLAEAMYLSKPVIATGYSGNADFMNEENSCLVRYDLIPVREGQYPYPVGQVWAEPDADHAVEYMLKLLSDRDYGRNLGAAASRYVRQYFSYRAMGLRYKARIEEILKLKESGQMRAI
jgi:glycosyltransferase involved in cell wall biosynthesis